MVSGLIKEWSKMELPSMVRVRQKFERPRVKDIAQTIREQFENQGLEERLQPGARIAVGVGSRGIHCIAEVTKAVIDLLKDKGFNPFIIPTMGSHGGATPEGQKHILEEYGITEETMGVEILSSLDVTEVGTVTIPSSPEAFPVYVDNYALKADGIVVINRVKPHTLFRGDVESGLMKMLTIGLGKHQGASMVHRQGTEYFHELIPAVGEKILEKAPIYFGVGIVENAYEEPADIRVVPKENFRQVDRELLAKAKAIMGKIKIPEIDVLILQEIGKDVSGDGMDPNVVGRYLVPGIKGDIQVQKIVVLDLTEKTEGNANGTGLADVITKRLFDKIDYMKSYINSFTATMLNSVKIPMIIDTDEEAIQVAVGACARVKPDKLKVVYVRNTLFLDEIYVSEYLAKELAGLQGFEIIGEPEPFVFDEKGNLVIPSWSPAHN
ncbi:MAG: DUF362 domain-containing protein [Bacillota bacterium]|uniref:DUF362 domain-containing protein n=1 Tax=Thermanaerosceptrum fracticalcis TaxID=1712410 RepID=A0A7G6E4D0_THEFR|nr:DUF362 domain-containing protein [Thermanaerosceptrum fracticalcis]QNB46934.1 DUF362 domain-containing protein [Thermanaerosceptrum fracticalcis]